MLRPTDTLPRQVLDPELVKLAEKLMAEERAACPTCKRGDLPSHFRAFIRDGVLYQTPCGSNSRIFDPTIPAFTGHPHCTCDYCF